MKKQSGFTLIELIVVILILGILGATALPKFVNVENEAHIGSHQGVAGAWQAAVMLTHAKWLAAGKPSDGGITIDTGTDIYMTSGWPTNISANGATVDAAGCAALWTALLQNNAPTVANGVGADYNTSTSAATNCAFNYTKTTTPGDLDINYETSTGVITIDKTLDGS